MDNQPPHQHKEKPKEEKVTLTCMYDRSHTARMGVLAAGLKAATLLKIHYASCSAKKAAALKQGK